MDEKRRMESIHNINTLCQKLKKELWQVVTLFHESLANWYSKCNGKAHFKHQIKSFLSMAIDRILMKYKLKTRNMSNVFESFENKIRDNRNMKLINLCKQMLEQIDMHQCVVGGFVLARGMPSHGQVSQVFFTFNITYQPISYCNLTCYKISKKIILLLS